MIVAEKKTKEEALDLLRRVQVQVKEDYEKLFQEIVKDPDPDFYLINAAFLATYSNRVAVHALEAGLTEDKLVEVIKTSFKEAYAAAPKWG